MNHLRALTCAAALFCGALPASANWLYTPGAGPSNFVSFNSGTTPAGTSLCAAANTDCLANVPINLAGNPLFVTGNAGLVTGTGGTFPATQSGTWTVQPGNTANTTAWLVTGTGGTFPITAAALPLPTGASTAANQATEIASLATLVTNSAAPLPIGTANGWTPLKLAALSNTATAVKGAAGWLGKLYCYNPNATVAYIQVYNVVSGSVTVGTTAALQSYGIPATNSAGFIMGTVGDQYSTAISVAATTAAGNGTAPGTAVDCNVSYN